jgi:hypothetical protein
MDATSLVRLRWRLRGAWLWPSFFVLSLADAAIISDLNLSGSSATSVVGAWLLGCVLSLLGIVLLGGLLGGVVRRLRPDMPRVVARNYAGAIITLAVTLVLLAAGLIHHAAVAGDQQALQDATAQAEAYIGTHAPAEFQRDLRKLDTYVVLPRVVYRVCAADAGGTRHYCVVVNRKERFGRDVHYSGSESNGLLSEGTS